MLNMCASLYIFFLSSIQYHCLFLMQSRKLVLLYNFSKICIDLHIFSVSALFCSSPSIQPAFVVVVVIVKRANGKRSLSMHDRLCVYALACTHSTYVNFSVFKDCRFSFHLNLLMCMCVCAFVCVCISASCINNI